MSDALQASNHWLDMADKEDELAQYEDARGHTGVSHRNKAQTYRRTGMALRIEHETGVPHCSCCLKSLGVRKHE